MATRRYEISLSVEKYFTSERNELTSEISSLQAAM